MRGQRHAPSAPYPRERPGTLQTSWLHRASNDVEHFLLPTDTHNAESVELLKHSKIDKNAPTCFGLHRDHLQGAKVSTWLKITR